MTMITDLPRDLTEEVLSRVPVTSLRAVRFTCTKWNTVSKRQSFTKKLIGQAAKKKQAEEFQVIMTRSFKLNLMSVNLHGFDKDDDNVHSSIQSEGTLISLNDANRVVQSKVFHCEGLLLCITKDNSKLVVWNPYSGQTRSIKPTNTFNGFDNFALGYEKKNKSHKILRFMFHGRDREFEIYNFESNSWKVIEVNPDWVIFFYQDGVSLKGNTYWFAREDMLPQAVGVIEHQVGEVVPVFLLCFDFTTERFGPRLPLPFEFRYEDSVTVSSVREEQLAVLFYRWDICYTQIWISNKIEPDAVSWSNLFLKFRLKEIPHTAASFFVDQKKKVAVVFGKGKSVYNPTRDIAYIIGENGYLKQVDLGKSASKHWLPHVCSYVPSSVQIQQPEALGKRKRSQIVD